MFSADMTLKPRQQKLVSFFDEHKLSISKEERAAQQRKRIKANNRLGRDDEYLAADNADQNESVDLLNMSSQLDAKSAYHRVALAQQKTHCDENDPEYNEIDGTIYKRIICPSDDDVEGLDDEFNDPMKDLRGTQPIEDMDNFIKSQQRSIIDLQTTF